MDADSRTTEPAQLTLRLTAAAEKAMKDPTKMSARERQFCLLLQREDKVSQIACLHLLPKVDVTGLIAKGYLIDEAPSVEGNEAAGHSQKAVKVGKANQDTKSESPPAPDSAMPSVFDPAALNRSFAKQRTSLRRAKAKIAEKAENKRRQDAPDDVGLDPALQLLAGDLD